MSGQQKASSTQNSGSPNTAGTSSVLISPPVVSLPKGGGAISGIGEKFSANPVTGTAAMSVPIALSSGRGGFGPQLSLSYDSGAGQSVFGIGWQLGLSGISRKTDKGLPRYLDSAESDIFLFSNSEDLVPVLDPLTGKRVEQQTRLAGITYTVYLYRPRIEGLFSRVERWSEVLKPENTCWRTLSRDNITTWYGREEESRVFDPKDKGRIYQWLISQTYDDKGNIAVYRYVEDNGNGVDIHEVWEANRQSHSRQANRYLKRILYGNAAPFLPEQSPELPIDWMFEAVFDYGDHSSEFPTPIPDRITEANPWMARTDAFSNHRAGFEVRTYRLCRRVLMFHHFRDAPGVGQDCLVRSTEFEYELPDVPNDPMHSGYTILRSVTHRSYQRKMSSSINPYESHSLPPVAFTYSQPVINQTVQTIDSAQLDNLPVGIQGPGYRWIDLDGEGLSGILAEQVGGWYYKSNLGNGKFGPMRVVAPLPAMALVASSRHQFMDLAGDGEIDVVDFSGPTPGFYERDDKEGWKQHLPFMSLPNIDWQDPNLRFLDLTGDGHADALITEQEVFTWYLSLDERGFAAAERTRQPQDEDSGPQLVFADGTQTIFLSDMCGDGLTDLIRIRNGEVCYWPNLGYGRFGRKVTLGNSPRFDHPDLFDPGRIRLADIDGSGSIDIIYLGRDGARLYFNRSGNSLSDPLTVNLPVTTENLGAVQVADLLGNGTACLVWNSHLPTDVSRPVYYIDLMGGAQENHNEHLKHEKPHLLIQIDNNLGGTTQIEYTPSTRFYLQDQKAGTPWVTRLPFPVHCVSKVTVRDKWRGSVRDKWRGTAFSSTYSYHHGYFDGVEREFRGFGRVEQVDVEDYGIFTAGNAGSPWITEDKTLFQPPVKTITWYHTGAALERKRILTQFEHEYFPQRFAARLPQGPSDFREKPLPEPELPADLSSDEWREALRACKGMVLRQEVYELDLEDLVATVPTHTPICLFSSAMHNCHIQRLQARGDNLHSVFMVTESEALNYHYELPLPKDGRALDPDPRIAHTLNLRHDELGNPQQSIAVGYPRWTPVGYADLPRPDLIEQVQSELHVAYTETHYTADVVLPEPPIPPTTTDKPTQHHRLRLPFEVLSYELKGIPKTDSHYYEPADFRKLHLSDVYGPQPSDSPPPPEVALKQYHEVADGTAPQKRIVEHARSRYFDDGDNASTGAPKTPTVALPFGQHGPRGLKYEDYKLALTTGLLNAVFNTPGQTDDKLAWEVQPAEGGKPTQTARDLLDDVKISGYWSGSQIGMHHSEYWVRSGIAGFASDANQHFFLPERYIDPFENETTLRYDPLDLFVAASTDALGNTTKIVGFDPSSLSTVVPGFDYRVLAPRETQDFNGNLSEVAFDLLGLPTAMAVKGKGAEGDNLESIDTYIELDLNARIAFFTSDFSLPAARRLLHNASTRYVQYFGETQAPDGSIRYGGHPPCIAAIQRERHVADLELGQESPLQIAFEYSDGSGNVLMKKVRAEAESSGISDSRRAQSSGHVGDRGEGFAISAITATSLLRWVVNGKTILNNKGKPVKQYEPYFTDSHWFEEPVENGVSPLIYYDAVGRVVRTESPDGTFSRVEFSPWHAKTWDQNDAVNESTWYASRNKLDSASRLPIAIPGPTSVDAEQRAGWLAVRHADTPSFTLLDSLGREVIAVAHNRVEDAAGPYTYDGRKWRDDFYLTYTKLDAEGKPLWIRDARDNLVMQYIAPSKPTRLADTPHNPNDSSDTTGEYVPAGSSPCYDIAGNLLHQHSMDADDRWMLMDAAGKPMLAWDFNQWQVNDTNFSDERRLYFTEYDKLHRPTRQWLSTWSRTHKTLEDFKPIGREQIERFEYQDAKLDDTSNLNGQLIRHYDTSGLVETIRRDFKGNVQEVRRTLVNDPTTSRTDWASFANVDGSSKLESETYIQITEHDALGRMARLFNWHRTGKPVAVYEPQYNERGLLQSESLRLHAEKTPEGYKPNSGELTQAIEDIHYNAKGQKEALKLGNGTVTQYEYDPATFRLRQIFTSRPPDSRFPAYRAQLSDSRVFQQLLYTYDPVGNITEVEDQAFKPVYFDGGVAEPRSLYEYDALYRLTWARGRETAQGGEAAGNGSEPTYDNGFPVTDQTMRTYTQRYEYDEVGNFVTMQHSAPKSGWTRTYVPDENSNQLLSTKQGADAVAYGYDTHGSMLNLANVDTKYFLRWDHRDMIRYIHLGGGGEAWYQYDSGKQRTRKFIQRSETSYDERVYLGGLERYRRVINNKVVEEIESLHLFEGEQRVLLVDDVQQADADAQPGPNGLSVKPQTLFRYQYSNHLGSVAAELDDEAKVITYEEFHPYGTSACRAMNWACKAPARRYRYTGMERDEESGLSYHAARFNSVTLGHWISCDPEPERDHFNAYASVRCNPISFVDTNGKWAELGHYYTVLLASLAVGKDLDSSLKLAFYVQLPDEVASTDAVANAPRSILSNWFGGGDKGTPHEVQVGLHALSGKNSADETSFRRERVLKSDYEFELGAALHAFGDSYSHRRLDDESKMYSPGFGHREDKTQPDEVAFRPTLFKEYAIDLYDTLNKLPGNRTAKLSREQYEKIISKVAAEPTETAQIKTLLDELRKTLPDVAKALDRSEASPILGDRLFRPEKSDFIPFPTESLTIGTVQSLFFSDKDAVRANEQMRQKLTPLQQRIVGFDGSTNFASAYLNLATEWTKARSEFELGR